MSSNPIYSIARMNSDVTLLTSWGDSLFSQFRRRGEIKYLDEAIAVSRGVLDLCLRGHLLRPASLHNLARYLAIRHNQNGGMDDLEEAITLESELLELRSYGHPARTQSLNNLGVDLSARYHRLGQPNDLDAAITLTREALELCPLGHPDSIGFLSNLSAYLYTRYNHLGLTSNLDEAILYSREAAGLCPLWYPDRSQSVDNLAACLFARYGQLGVMSDLEETIVYAREARYLWPPGHSARTCSLNNLARYIFTRYDQLGTIEDLKEAIFLAKEVLELSPHGDPGRSCSLNNLADYLTVQYNQLEDTSDLQLAIDLSREALELRPHGHPFRPQILNDLAIRLYTRYGRIGDIGDLEEAIFLSREALQFLPSSHPARSSLLIHLARYLRTRFVQVGEIRDRKELFSLYSALSTAQTVSFTDLSAAKDWVCVAEEFGHSSTLLAYKTSLQLLVQHLAVLPSLPQHLAILKKRTSSLAVDAFSASLRYNAPALAVELLEQGRAVFWSQLARLRHPLDEVRVVTSGRPEKILAGKFRHLSLLIRNVLGSPSVVQHDRAWHLAIQLQEVVTEIRRLPGLSRFLLPALFSDLRKAASEGPVIIVNASQYSCDALVVLPARDPIHIPLEITRTRISQLSSDLRFVSSRAKVRDVMKDLAFILRELWDEIVSPIVEVLLEFQPRGSRIWWCPTAEFSHLPLHAAGPYRKGQQNLTDLYISSYTPTLTALIRARQSRSSSVTERPHFIALGQAHALGNQPLLSVSSELASISQRVAPFAAFTRIEGPDATVARVTRELSKNEWVHLACHGIPNQRHPFESAFALYDGPLKVEDIMQCEMQNPQFAYLSACHTTVGDESSPDEVIHLASAMQFSGFRSVIGTMWAVDDAHTEKIASVFYENMVDASGRLDYTRAAFALHKTMSLVKIPFDQRILFIHLGV